MPLRWRRDEASSNFEAPLAMEPRRARADVATVADGLGSIIHAPFLHACFHPHGIVVECVLPRAATRPSSVRSMPYPTVRENGVEPPWLIFIADWIGNRPTSGESKKLARGDLA